MQLRKSLICHYCGKKSNKSKLDRDRFECEKCGSVNIYDENGEIVDVSPEETNNTQRYALPLASFEPNDIFCSTCVKNQYLFTSALSEFLPDPEDYKYDEIEAALPKFKQHLEERYPQCCARCEPRVRAQLEQATYHARSDHMRRMLERSRARRVSHRFGWRSLLVSSTGAGYFASLAVQSVWHAMGLVRKDDALINRPTNCLKIPVSTGCVTFVQSYIGWSLLVALLCVWWNPQWQHKVGGYEGRLVGLGRYYQMQLIVLLMRFVAWIWLADFSPAQMYQEMVHSLFLIMTLAMSALAMLTVKVDKTPLVNWEYQQPELVSEKQFVPPSPKVRPTFNISALAPTTRPDLQPWHPPTPPLESDEMDWTPSQHFDTPKQPRFRNAGPNPFHGTLPTVRGHTRRQETKQAIGLPPGHFDKRDRLPAKKDAASFMAEPKFFPRNSDTGLENIFGQVFSLHEPTSVPAPPPPAPIRTKISKTARKPQVGEKMAPAQPKKVPLLFAALLVTALALWSMAGILEVAAPNLKVSIIGAVLLLCFTRLAMTQSEPTPIRLFLLVEILALGALEAQLFSKDHIIDDVCDKLGMGLLASLMLQEVWMYLQGDQQGQLMDQADFSTAEDVGPPTPRVSEPRRYSDESVASEASIATTSTAPDWRTPQVDRFNMRGLDLNGFGAGVASPRRNRNPRAR